MYFNIFKDLRNRHLIHDENSCAQCIPGAILNKRDQNCKIEKIICFTMIVATIGQENYANLHLLIKKAKEWVINEFDQMCEILTKELEAKSYDDLFACKEMTCKVPTIDDIGKKREAP